MRNEETMVQLIKTIAAQDDNILAAYLNGSRANPNAPKDIFQDFDLVYVVKSTKPYIQDKNWINCFGERLMMQAIGEEQSEEEKQNFYGWLMLFTDGNRIDLHVETLQYMQSHILDDSLCLILYDIHQLMPNILPSDETYWIKKPTQEMYAATCNEFWWCLQNVSKGVWRCELSYALDMLNNCVRPCLLALLHWKAGVLTEFKFNGGKSGKYLHTVIPKEEWSAYLETYSGVDYSLIDAIEIMMNLFHTISKELADHFQFVYQQEEATKMRQYVNHVLRLSTEAKSIY